MSRSRGVTTPCRRQLQYKCELHHAFCRSQPPKAAFRDRKVADAPIWATEATPVRRGPREFVDDLYSLVRGGRISALKIPPGGLSPAKSRQKYSMARTVLAAAAAAVLPHYTIPK
jgi:hypothetical protein